MSMAHFLWTGRLLGGGDRVITHVKFQAKVATLFGRKIDLVLSRLGCHSFLSSERRELRRHLYFCGLYFSSFYQFWNLALVPMCVIIMAQWSIWCIHNCFSTTISSVINKKKSIWRTLWKDGFLKIWDSDMRHWKWRGPLNHFQHRLSERLQTSCDMQGW